MSFGKNKKNNDVAKNFIRKKRTIMIKVLHFTVIEKAYCRKKKNL